MDERIVEVISEVMARRPRVPASWRIEDARLVLTALRDAGFNVVKSDTWFVPITTEIDPRPRNSFEDIIAEARWHALHPDESDEEGDSS